VGEDGSKVGDLLRQLRWLDSLGIQTVLRAVLHVDRITPLEVIGREVVPASQTSEHAGPGAPTCTSGARYPFRRKEYAS
jgi:hypothetical protein